MSKDVLLPLNKVLMSGFITQGQQVEKFERELKKYNLKFIPFKTNKGIIKVKDLNSKHGIFIDIFQLLKSILA